MVDYNIVCNEIAKRVESGELSSEEAQSIMEKADAMYGDGELLTENYDDSITEKLNDAMVQYKKAQAEAKEYIKNKEYSKANIALQKLLTSLKTIKEEVKNTKPDSKGAATLIVAKTVAKDAASGAFIAAILSSLLGSDKVWSDAATVGLATAMVGAVKRAVRAVNRDGKIDSTAFDDGKQFVIESIDKYIDDVNKTILKIANKVGKEDSEKKEADESEKTESVDDIEQVFNDIDAYLEGCSGCKDKEKSDDECSGKKKKKAKKSDEVTEAVIDAIAERIEAVTEAYLDDKIDEDEYNECMTLLDINNYDCFFFE